MSYSGIEQAELLTNTSFSGTYANAVTPLWAKDGAGAIPPDIQVSSIAVGLPVGFGGGITLDAPATNLGATNAAPILFNRTDDYPSPNDYSRLAMTITRGSSLYPPFSADEQNVSLRNNFGTFYDTFATGDLLVYGLVNTTNSPAGPIARLTQNLASDPNRPELDIDARAVHISSLIVSSINGQFPNGGGGSYNPNPQFSTVTLNNGGNLTLQVSSGTSVLRQWQNTSDLELTGSGLHLSTLYVSSISNYVFNVSSIQSSNVSSIAGEFGKATIDQLSTFVSNTVKQIVSSVSFNASLGGVNLGGVDLGLGGYLGGLTGQLVTGATSITIAGVALATGATALATARVTSNIYLPGQNSNGFNVVNGQTQLQFSTLGSPVSTFTRFTSSIAGSDPSVNPQPERVVFNTIPGNTLCIRSFSDPISPVNPSTFTSTLQSFGQWVAVPNAGGGAGSFSTVTGDFVVQSTLTANKLNVSTNIVALGDIGGSNVVGNTVIGLTDIHGLGSGYVLSNWDVGSNLRVGQNISTPSISTTSLRVGGNAQIVGSLTAGSGVVTGSLTAANAVVGSVVLPGGGVVNATTLTANTAGITTVTATNVNTTNINGSPYPPTQAQFSTTTGDFLVPNPYILRVNNILVVDNLISAKDINIGLTGSITGNKTNTQYGDFQFLNAQFVTFAFGTLNASNNMLTNLSTTTVAGNLTSTRTITASNFVGSNAVFSGLETAGIIQTENLFFSSIIGKQANISSIIGVNEINGLPYPPPATSVLSTFSTFAISSLTTNNIKSLANISTGGALFASNATVVGQVLAASISSTGTINATGIIRGGSLSTIGSLSAGSVTTIGSVTAANASIGGTLLNPGGNVNCTNLTVSGTLSFSGNFTVGGTLTVNSNIIASNGSVSARQLISATDVIGATLNISNNALSINQTGTILTANGNYTTTNGTITATNGDINAPNGNVGAATGFFTGDVTMNTLTAFAANVSGQVQAGSIQSLGNIAGQTIYATSLINTGGASITQNLGVGSNLTVDKLLTASTINTDLANITTVSSLKGTFKNLNTNINPSPGTQEQIGSPFNTAPNRATNYASPNNVMMKAVGITYNSAKYTIPSITNNALAFITGLQIYYQTPCVIQLYMQTTSVEGVNALYNIVCLYGAFGYQEIRAIPVITQGLAIQSLFINSGSPIATIQVQNVCGQTITTLKCSWTIFPLDG